MLWLNMVIHPLKKGKNDFTVSLTEVATVDSHSKNHFLHMHVMGFGIVAHQQLQGTLVHHPIHCHLVTSCSLWICIYKYLKIDQI